MSRGVHVPQDETRRRRIINLDILEEQKDIHKTCAIVLSNLGAQKDAIDHLKKYIASIYGGEDEEALEDVIEQNKDLLDQESEKTYKVEEVEF